MKKFHSNFLEPPQQQLNNLLEHYQTRRYAEAQKLATSITEEFPKHPFAWKVLAAVLKQTGRISELLVPSQKSVQLNPQDAEACNNRGVLLQELERLDEAEKSYRKAIALKPDYTEAHNNLGVTLKELERLDEAEASFRQVIELKPDYAEAHNNLGVTLKELGRLDEAEASLRQVIELKPDYAEAYYNLGITFQELGRLDEAEASYGKAIALKPDYAIAHNNLGITLKGLGRLDEAEASLRQVIVLKPDFAKAHNNLGNTLKELGRLDEAEASLRQAIELKPDYAEAYYNLGITFQELGRLDEAEASYTQAIALKPDFADSHNNLDILLSKKKLLMKIFEAKKYRDNVKIRNLDSEVRLVSNPFISNREVETNLISNLYKIRLKHLDKTKGPKTKGPLFGNGKTTDFSFFKDNQSIIKDVENDLSVIMRQAVRSEIYVYESFLNIFNNGSGSLPHDHVDSFDKSNNLINQKFSLQYYLSVGDQTCSEPGIFKLKDPDEEILPSNGMIMVIPASRLHSAVYNGKVDRVMIGVNFYSLL